jgi:hypothetical protein
MNIRPPHRLRAYGGPGDMDGDPSYLTSFSIDGEYTSYSL